MTRKQTDTKAPETLVYSPEIRLKPEHAADIVNRVAGDLTETQKVGLVATQYLTDIAEGGLLLTNEELHRIAESTGVEATCGEDLLTVIAEGSGREEGKLKVPIIIDPAYESAYEEVAQSQGRTIQEILQETVDVVMDREWVYELIPSNRPEQVLMSPAVKRELEEILGEKFSTGMDLAGLVKKALGMEGGLFADLTAQSTSGPEAA